MGGGMRRRRVLVIVSAVLVTGLATALVCLLGPSYVRKSTTVSLSERGKAASGEAVVLDRPASPKGEDRDASKLPFSVSGVSSDGTLAYVSEGTSDVGLSDTWEFGGDYASIGSFPIDADTVFGSIGTPYQLPTYVASRIGRSGSAQPLEAVQTLDADNAFYEPQDGTGDSQGIVWRSASVNDATRAGIDDWRLQAWSAESGESRVLGTARQINGRDDTPMVYGEVVPTANEATCFYASNVVDESGAWHEKVLAFPLDGSEGYEVVDDGNLPAAVDDGVIYAAPSSGEGYTRVRHAGTDGIKDVLTIDSDDDSWHVTGVWAHDGYRAVAVSGPSSDSGTYIGLWKDGFGESIGWLHVDSPTVVASMNDRWIVWGAGSQAYNTGMYAFNWESRKTLYLGNAPGYARPTVAADSDVVMVPQYVDEYSPVRFLVGKLD